VLPLVSTKCLLILTLDTTNSLRGLLNFKNCSKFPFTGLLRNPTPAKAPISGPLIAKLLFFFSV